MSALPYIPRTSRVITADGLLSMDYDRSCLQPLINAVNALTTTILSGPDADPNGIVIGSPGYLYRALGPSVVTSQLWVKESGVDTDTGWVGK